MARRVPTVPELLPTLAISLALATLACTPAGPERRQAVLRFLPAPAEELFDPRSLLREEEATAWELRQPEEARSWKVTGAGVVAAADRGAWVLEGPAGGERAIERQVDLAAGEVQALALTYRKTPRTAIDLEWAAPGEPFSAERRITVRAAQVPVGALPTLRFPVGEHPAWRGRVERIRLTFHLGRSTRLLLLRLAALTVTAGSSVVPGKPDRPWLVDLGGDARGALLLPVGSAVERELEVPRGATFETAYGVAGDVGTPIAFRVTFADAGGSAAQTLFQDEISTGAAEGWRTASVDLGPLAGRRGRLRLETVPGGETSATGSALAAWGHPEVLAAPAGGAGADAQAGAPPNVLLVSIDTLRADRLSLYGHDRPTSPRLDAWARRRAVVFDEAVAAAPWTLPAHTSMFTGLEAYRHGVNYDFAAPAALTTLAERLHAAGYRTLAITGGGLLSPRFGLAQGFDAFVPVTSAGEEGDLPEVTRRALAALAANRDRPFFLFVHTYEMHAPYRPRAPHFQRFAGGEPALQAAPGANELVAEDGYASHATLKPLPLVPGGAPSGDLSPEALANLARDLYDSEVAYTDEHLGRLFEALRELDLERRTAVVVTSDHGEMLGEHGQAGHAYLYDENLLVPLVVATPDGRGAGSRVARQVGQVDLVPTILELVGIADPGGLDGRSLVPLLADPAAADGDGAAEAWAYAPRTNQGVALRVGGRLKWTLRTAPWPPTRGQARRFDLGDDPGEARSVPETAPAVRRRLVDELAGAYGGLYLTAANAGAAPLVADLRAEALVIGSLHALDLDCDCLRMVGPYRARIELPPGRRFTLRLEDPAGDRLELDARLAGVDSGTSTFDFSALAVPQALAWHDGAWRRQTVAPGAGVATGFVLGWGRGGPRSARRAHEGDEALREQLRALGYLQ